MAPLGTADVDKMRGRAEKSPEDYEITAVIAHLDTVEELKLAVALLRLQTLRPFICVVDTGSSPETVAKLEELRAPDLEIHFIRGHSWRHTSEPVTAALDLAESICRTRLLFHTHADVFLRRRDFLENFARVTNANTPVVGYRMSPRDWITSDWEWMVGHTATFFYMPSIFRSGAVWSLAKMHHAHNIPWKNLGGWPDTETGKNMQLRAAGIVPVFIGHDRNEPQFDDNFDHCRSFTGHKIYGAEYFEKTKTRMAQSLSEGWARVQAWESEILKLEQK